MFEILANILMFYDSRSKRNKMVVYNYKKIKVLDLLKLIMFLYSNYIKKNV